MEMMKNVSGLGMAHRLLEIGLGAGKCKGGETINKGKNRTYLCIHNGDG